MTTPWLPALVADGPSDRALIRPLTWAIRQGAPTVPLRPFVFEPRAASIAVADAVDQVVRDHRPDLVFVHRDAERSDPALRRKEIPVRAGLVPVIPVRMTEAWLLIDERAIRRAAGRPSGTEPLALPPVSRIERHADPKTLLRTLLIEASGLRGRRRQRFDRAAAIQRVADLIDDFGALRQLGAFRALEKDLELALRVLARSRR